MPITAPAVLSNEHAPRVEFFGLTQPIRRCPGRWSSRSRPGFHARRSSLPGPVWALFPNAFRCNVAADSNSETAASPWLRAASRALTATAIWTCEDRSRPPVTPEDVADAMPLMVSPIDMRVEGHEFSSALRETTRNPQVHYVHKILLFMVLRVFVRRCYGVMTPHNGEINPALGGCLTL